MRNIRIARTVACVLVAGALVAQPGFAQESDAEVAEAVAVDSAHEAAILEFFEAKNVGPNVIMGLEVGFEDAKAADPSTPEGFWVDLGVAMRQKMPEFLAMMVPVYAKHFSQQEVEGLARFYESPLGQRVSASELELTTETLGLMQAWITSVANDVAMNYAEPAGLDDMIVE